MSSKQILENVYQQELKVQLIVAAANKQTFKQKYNLDYRLDAQCQQSHLVRLAEAQAAKENCINAICTISFAIFKHAILQFQRKIGC